MKSPFPGFRRFSPAWLTVVLGGALLALGGCGVKAPPVPPALKPAVIKVLSHVLDNGSLTLTWALADGSAIPESYTLYRSRKLLSGKACEGCPSVFERFMVIYSDGQRSGMKTLLLVKGYRYAFKLTATITGGFEGPDSNTVKFDY